MELLRYRLKRGLKFITDGETAYRIAAFYSNPFENPEKFIYVDELFGCVEDGRFPTRAIRVWFREKKIYDREKVLVRPENEEEMEYLGFAEKLTPEKIFLLLEEYPGLYRTLRDQGYEKLLELKKQAQAEYIWELGKALEKLNLKVEIGNEWEDRAFRRLFSINEMGRYSYSGAWRLSDKSEYREDADKFCYYVNYTSENKAGKEILVGYTTSPYFPSIKFREMFKFFEFYRTGYNVGYEEGYNACKEKELQPLKCELEEKIEELKDRLLPLELLKSSGIPVPEINIYTCCGERRSLSLKDPITGKEHYFNPILNPIPPVEELAELYNSIFQSIFKPDVVINKGEEKRHLLLFEQDIDPVAVVGEEWMEAVRVRWEGEKLFIHFFEYHAEIGEDEDSDYSEYLYQDVDEILQRLEEYDWEVLEIDMDSEEQPVKLKFSKSQLPLPIFKLLGEFENEKKEKIYVYKFSCP